MHASSSSADRSAASAAAPRRFPSLLSESRFFVSPVAFEAQMHLQSPGSSLVVTQQQARLSLDVLRDVRVGGRLVEGWDVGERDELMMQSPALRHNSGSAATSFEPTLSSERMRLLQRESRLLVEMESEPMVLLPSVPASRRVLAGAIVKGAVNAAALGGEGLGRGANAAPFPLPALPGGARNPLHKRVRVSLPLPAPDALSNTSSTRHFTLLLYAALPSSDDDGADNDGEDTSSEDEDEHEGKHRDANATAKARRAGTDSRSHKRVYRFALSVRLWAGDDQLHAPPPPLPLPASPLPPEP
jgi:hypothetical protein